jgi:Tfp pilus assembly protein PilF
MVVASDAAWRVLILLAAAIAPRLAPVEAVSAQSAAIACLRLALVIAVYAVATFAIRKSTPRYPGVAALTTLALLGAPIASAYFSGDRGPLARGVWLLGPLVWAALAAIAAGPITDQIASQASRRMRAVAGVTVIAIGMASLVAGGARFASANAMWQSALDTDPGNESASLVLASVAKDAQKPVAALDLLLGCARVHPESCACAEGAASYAIDLGRYPDARRVLDASDACQRTPRRMSIDAESLVGTPGAMAEGIREAARVLERNPDEPHALFARAWGTVLEGRPVDALPDAQRAVALGRGVPAELLYGLILFQDDDFAGADVQFVHVLTEDPASVQATYDHALVADRQQRYHDAREGYLHTLALDATNAEARYNLVVLTHAHGATLEAQHDVDEFAAKHPNDARLITLRQILATPVQAR